MVEALVLTVTLNTYSGKERSGSSFFKNSKRSMHVILLFPIFWIEISKSNNAKDISPLYISTDDLSIEDGDVGVTL
jgi:hypothetical protein